MQFCDINIPQGGIFILKSNLITAVAFLVLGFVATIYAYAIFNNNKINIVKVTNVQKIAMIADSQTINKELINNVTNEQRALEAQKKALEEKKKLESQKKAEAVKMERSTNLTSRSSSALTRQNTVYYEALNLNVTEEEIEILERIIQAEAGGSGYNGGLAVANVILNRVQSSRFPNTIKGVVFSGKQFSPVSNGSYYRVKVNATTKQVVVDALNGARIVGTDAYYFCTPTASGRGWFERDLRKIAYVAPHNIYGYK